MYIIYTMSCAKLITVQELMLKVTTAVTVLIILIPDACKVISFTTKNLRGCYNKHSNNNQEHSLVAESLIEFERSGLTPNTTIST